MKSMDSKKDYKEDIIHVLAEAANYAALFNLRVEYLEAIDKDASWFSSTDIVENEDWKEIDVYVNLESFNNFLGEIPIDLAEKYLYSSIYSNVARNLSKMFNKCKHISKLVKDEDELFRFGCSFIKGDPKQAFSSALRSELELTNTMWIKYQNEKEKFPAA